MFRRLYQSVEDDIPLLRPSLGLYALKLTRQNLVQCAKSAATLPSVTLCNTYYINLSSQYSYYFVKLLFRLSAPCLCRVLSFRTLHIGAKTQALAWKLTRHRFSPMRSSNGAPRLLGELFPYLISSSDPLQPFPQ